MSLFSASFMFAFLVKAPALLTGSKGGFNEYSKGLHGDREWSSFSAKVSFKFPLSLLLSLNY
jgi:hypothetical protein